VINYIYIESHHRFSINSYNFSSLNPICIYLLLFLCYLLHENSRYEYRWADGVQIKKPIEVSAPKYVEYLMDWIESQLDDESIFPQRLGKYFTLSFIKIIGPSHHDHYFHSCCMTLWNHAGSPFPPNFKDVVKTIFKRLFRVYAHIYHSHFQKIVSLKEEAHLNTCFKHFILFTCVSLTFFYSILLCVELSSLCIHLYFPPKGYLKVKLPFDISDCSITIICFIWL
jgi:hypothetical protein